MKKFLNLIITSMLVLPATITFNNNQNNQIDLISSSNSNNSNEFAFNIQRFYIRQQLATIGALYLGSTDIIDLTSLTGISSINMFKKFYSWVELPDFHAHIQMVSIAGEKNNFSVNTSSWQENTTSTSIVILEGLETIGGADMNAALTARIIIEKNSDVNHLLLRINFYGTASYNSSSIGEIDTGQVMKLIAS